jgi:hypothetical protein
MRLVTLAACSVALMGCADLMPTTTRVVATTPLAPSPHEAVVVVSRPSPTGSAGAPDALPLDERYSFLRIIDEKRTVLADLRFNEHAAIRMQPGAHELFAYHWWDDGQRAPCVGALAATLAGGRVYPVLARELEHLGGRKYGCNHVELVRALSDERSWFWRWTRESSRRSELLADRDRSIFLDAPWMSQVHVEVGRLRLRGEEAPVHASASLSPDDGEPTAL